MEIAHSIATICDKALLVAGGVLVFNAAYEIIQARQQQRPSTGEEWWALTKGALVLGVGVLQLVTKTITAIAG